MSLINCYLTVPELRDMLRDQLTANDQEYERAIAAASRQVDDYCGRPFWREAAPVARLLRPDTDDVVWTGDIATTAGLTVETDDGGTGSFTSWSVTDYQVEPFTPAAGRPYDRIAAIGGRTFPVLRESRRPTIRITAAWGWPAVPAEVRQACALLAQDHFRAKDVGVPVSRPDLHRGYIHNPPLTGQAEYLLRPLRIIALA